MGLLNNEMRIIKLRIKYPEQFQQHAWKIQCKLPPKTK